MKPRIFIVLSKTELSWSMHFIVGHVKSKFFVILQDNQFGHSQIIKLKIRLLHLLLHPFSTLMQPKQPFVFLSLLNQLLWFYQFPKVLLYLIFLLHVLFFSLYLLADLGVQCSLFPIIMKCLKSVSGFEPVKGNSNLLFS